MKKKKTKQNKKKKQKKKETNKETKKERKHFPRKNLPQSEDSQTPIRYSKIHVRIRVCSMFAIEWQRKVICFTGIT